MCMSLTLVIQNYYQNVRMCGLSSLFCVSQPDNQCSENNIMWGVQQVMTPKYFSEDIIFLFKVITCWI